MNQASPWQNPSPQNQKPYEGASGQYLSFWLDRQLFGIAITQVVQIIETFKIVPMPDYPEYAKGVIELRKEIVPVIDMRIRLGKKEQREERTCIVVINLFERKFGLIVDAVNEVATFGESEIAQIPEMTGKEEDGVVLGIGNHGNQIVLLLNTTNLFERAEMNQMTHSQQ